MELMKVYEVLTDRDAEKHRQVRVVDESGEDYLYPGKIFCSSEAAGGDEGEVGVDNGVKDVDQSGTV